MASSSSSSLFLLVAIIISSLSTISARPCKTFLISSYSLSITPENPNLSSSPHFVTVFTIRRLYPHPIPFFVNRHHGFLPSSAAEKPQIREDRHPQVPFPENVKDRTRDILSVVVALLFGVGCGALTAATMYLVWAIVVNHPHEEEEEEEEEDYENEESDAACLKKLGYVKIPDPVKEAA